MKNLCDLCPRNCGADRSERLGFCGAPNEIMLARAALHFYEEPPISGTCGSGTLFFCGCNLRCVYCQNAAISRFASDASAARKVSEEELCSIMLRLQDEGAHNINLVTPTPYSDRLARVLEAVKPRLHIPVLYNCGGYESVHALKSLDELVDIYMPDFKYASSQLSQKYSGAADYSERAAEALAEMYRQRGRYIIGDDGMMKSGVLVRHLVLPGCRKDSEKVLEIIGRTVPAEGILLSIMRQYTPEFAPEEMKELRRTITSFEYDSVVSAAEKYGFEGFIQDKASAETKYTPNFNIKTF